MVASRGGKNLNRQVFMNRVSRLVSTVSLLAMSLFMWSCDQAEQVTEPQLSPAPLVVMSKAGKRFRVAAERNPEVGSVSAEIGRAGGVLVLGRHTLTVSRGAVDAPTTFTMTRDPSAPLRVQLTAGRESQNDVGAAGFAAPVTLSLSFQNAADTPRDRTSITIIYFRPDGLVEELETEVRVVGKVASAELPHFSLFGLAWP